MNLDDGMTLYHGSYAPIETVDLKKCAAGKDFGQGFYLTSSYDQAQQFISTSLKKAYQIGAVTNDHCHGYVSAFRFHAPSPPLNTYVFPTANEQWLWFVSTNRRARMAEKFASRLDAALKNPDIIIGKIANDNTNPVIAAFLSGLYGPATSTEAANTAIALLLPNKLKDQFCFLTDRAISCLEPLEITHHES